MRDNSLVLREVRGMSYSGTVEAELSAEVVDAGVAVGPARASFHLIRGVMQMFTATHPGAQVGRDGTAIEATPTAQRKMILVAVSCTSVVPAARHSVPLSM